MKEQIIFNADETLTVSQFIAKTSRPEKKVNDYTKNTTKTHMFARPTLVAYM